ncbi:MAG: tyrosine-type recombinase/integrase [Actinomycetota bacterium]
MTEVSVANKQRRANGQGSIYWDPKRKRWVASAFDIHNKRHSKFYKRKQDAENWLHEQRIARQLGNTTYALDSRATVGEFLLVWLEQYRGNIRPNTYRNYRETINSRIIPYIGQNNAAKLAPQSVEKLYGTLREKGYRAGSIRIVHRVLSVAYNHAVRMEVMPRNPIAKVRIPKIESVPTKHIHFDHYQRILYEASFDPYMNARVIVGMCIGLRNGEIYGLKWSDIDWKNKTLTIERQVQRVKGQGLDFYPVKQGTIRTIPLTDNWIVAFQQHQHFQYLKKGKWVIDRDLIFPGHNGDFLEAKQDRKRWKKLLKWAGLPDYESRQMRKTAFTYMAQKTDLKTLMEFSGHTQVSTLMKSYVFASSESLNGAIKAIDGMYPEIDEIPLELLQEDVV